MTGVRILDSHCYGDRAMDYRAAWLWQRELHAERTADRIADTVLLMEHPPVFTAGKRTEDDERPAVPGDVPVIDVDRGGKITFHGPGQLIGYPICRLPSHVFVVDYVRRLEEALIRTVTDFGAPCGRVAGRSGVWLASDHRGPERKIAQIGIRISRGVTMHGFSLNCNVSLEWFDSFVPCGISDAAVTSLSHELGRDVPVPAASMRLTGHLADLLQWQPYEPSPDISPSTAIPITGI